MLLTISFLLFLQIKAQTSGPCSPVLTSHNGTIVLFCEREIAQTNITHVPSIPTDLPADSEISCHADGATITTKDGKMVSGWRTRATMRRKDGTEWKKTFLFRTKLTDATRDCELWVKMVAKERERTNTKP